MKRFLAGLPATQIGGNVEMGRSFFFHHYQPFPPLPTFSTISTFFHHFHPAGLAKRVGVAATKSWPPNRFGGQLFE
jgi:hypothetical protein